MGAEHQNSEAIRGQLERILASAAFSRANRSSQLLRHLVEATLAGQHEDLKEYAIATKAFGKPESFDPRIDSLVRVEATRLRNRLQTYYESAGPDEPIEIALAPGTYEPTFESRIPEPPAEIPEAPPEFTPAIEPARARRLALWFSAAAVALIVGFVLFRITGKVHSGAPERFKALQRLSIPDEVLIFPGLSPGGSHVYFASNRGGGGFRIWRQTWDGQAQKALTPEGSDAYDLDVSPDGAWITYWSSRYRGAIYQQPSSGGEELMVAAEARSPRFSPDGKHIVYWMEGTRGGYGKLFVSGITPGTFDREPKSVAADFDDAHNPQWTPDRRVLLCGTKRSNVPQMEHDLWVVSAGPASEEKPPIKTGILPFLQERNIRLHPRPFAATSFRIIPGSLIFSGLNKGKAGTYRLRLDSAWHPDSEPELLHDTASSADNPNIRDQLLTFATLKSNLNIWSVPLNEEGTEAGPLRRLTQDEGEEFSPSLSVDGRWLHFAALRPPKYEVWRKDMVSGVESIAYQGDDARLVKGIPDGSKVFFRSLMGTFPQRQTILSVESEPGVSKTVCDDCGALTSVSPRGEFVAYETGSRISRIAAIDTRTGTKHDVVSDPHLATQAARISPDGNWIAFELDKGVVGKQIMIAPFRGLAEIPEKEWIPATSGGFSFEPAWDPTGSKLYFISDRLGSRDLWMQRVDTKTKKPVGEPQVVHRFRNSNLTPLSYSERSTRYIGLSVGRGHAVLTLSELSSSIQLVSLDE